MALAATEPKFEELKWGDTSVIYIPDDRFPTFNVSYYFADGSLSDPSGKWGLTNAMFDLLTMGTKTMNQMQIAQALDLYATSFSAQIFPEYTLVNTSGLLSQFDKSMDTICHVFKEANFPDDQVSAYVKRSISGLENMVASPSELAERASWYYTHLGSPFANFYEGTISSLSTIKTKDLIHHWDYFSKKLVRKIYIMGPKALMGTKHISRIQDCLPTQLAKEKRDALNSAVDLSKIELKGKIIFVTVPSANQVQIRWSAVLPTAQVSSNYDLAALSTGLLGSGFTSLLMQEVRVKKGYTYSIGASSAARNLASRSLISTFTKNKTLLETMQAVTDVVSGAAKTFSSEIELNATKKYLTGKQLLQYDNAEKFLSVLINYGHLGRSYSDLTAFEKNTVAVKPTDIRQSISSIFPLDQGTWVLVGDGSLEAVLRKQWGDKLIVKNYLELIQ
jgi:zinc protease